MRLVTVLLTALLIILPSPVFSQTPNVNDIGETNDDNVQTDTTGAVSREEAVKEARSKLKEPGPVRDLTDPGIVYSQLSEGVSAWVASLGGNRDAFGNEVTSSYVTASRPDVVPASLQAFLLGYYKDNCSVGLAFGPEGVTEATSFVQNSYNDSVNSLADEIMEAGNAADDSSDDSDNSEPVPVLDDEDSDSADDTDTNSDSDNSSDDPSTNLSGAAAIEEKYKVDLQEGDKDFTAAELEAVDSALSSLPSSFYEPMNIVGETETPTPARIKRMSSITFEGQPAFGIYRRNAPSVIEISDVAWDLYENDYPVPPFTEAEARQAQFGGTLVHEMLHRRIGTDSDGYHIEDAIDKPFVAEWATAFGWTNSGGSWSVADPSTCVTQYAGMANPEEDIAESVMMYVYWPNKLKAINQEKYNFIKSQIGVKESGKSTPYPG